MKSLEVLLAESLGRMSAAQKEKFFGRRVNGSPIEGQVALAAEVLQESGRTRIARNNGGTRELSVAESREAIMAEGDAMLMEGLAKSRPQGCGRLAEVSEGSRAADGLSESQREDYEFCRLLRMSESEALRVAKSGCVRQN